MIWLLLLLFFPVLVIIAKYTQTPTIEEQEEINRANELKAKEYYSALAEVLMEEYERSKETE